MALRGDHGGSGPGRPTLECPGAVEGGSAGGAPWARGPWGATLGLFAWDGKSPLGNLIDLENSYWNPREVTFGGLVSPGMGGNLPSPAKDFKQSRDRSHGSTCSSQVQGQNARTQPGLVTASREPRPPPNSEHSPVCLAKDKCWLVGADSHFTGVVLIAEVLNELRKHKQMMRDIHPCT